MPGLNTGESVWADLVYELYDRDELGLIGLFFYEQTQLLDAAELDPSIALSRLV